MKVVVTYREIMNGHRWEEFCEAKNVNVYCVADGCDEQTEVELSVKEAILYNLIEPAK